MHLIIERNRLLIVPEKNDPDQGALDTAFLEEVLGLRNLGDTAKATRVAVMGLPDALAYIEIKK